MSAPTVTAVRALGTLRAELGEGPVSSDSGRTVHWVDLFAGLVHTTDVASARTRTISVPTAVGAVAVRAGGGFVAAVADGFATIDPDGALVLRHDLLGDGLRMNDAACDTAGRFWAGSTAYDFAAGRGALHVLLPDWTTRQVLDGLTQPNGMGWSPDGRTFYLIDSAVGTLNAWDVDPATAELSHGRVLLEFPLADGAPDGLCVDAEGDLWIALWGGSALLKVSPDGVVRRRVPLPVRQPTSCAFVGRDHDVLLVTSAAEGLDPEPTSPDGGLLTLTGTGSRGLPQPRFGG